MSGSRLGSALPFSGSNLWYGGINDRQKSPANTFSNAARKADPPLRAHSKNSAARAVTPNMALFGARPLRDLFRGARIVIKSF